MKQTALQRLLKYPHAAVFDKAPAAELALRLRHPDGASWRVADGVLTASAAGTDWSYDISSHTVGSLAAALDVDGFEVAYLSPEFAARGASVLVEGAGDEALSNGDHLTAFTSPLWAIMSGYASEVREAEYQSEQALRQMVITQAEGEWLDLWGALYSEARLPGESDAAYAPRIPKEAFRIRVNGMAIEQAVKDRTGRDIEIREPWRMMFALDKSALSGGDHFPDERYYSYFVIHPVAREAFDWSGPLSVINRNRPAGIEVYSPSVEFSVRHVDVQPPVLYQVENGGLQLRSAAAWAAGDPPLGEMRLSDNEFTLNHPMMVYAVMTFSNGDALGMGGEHADLLNINFVLDSSRLAGSVQKIVNTRDIAYASIALSDGVPLGDENAILSRGIVDAEMVPPQTLSEELAPSDYAAVRTHHRVERVLIDQHAESVSFPVEEIAVSVAVTAESLMLISVDRIDPVRWSGSWDSRKWYSDEIVMGMSITVQRTAPGNVLNYNLWLNESTID